LLVCQLPKLMEMEFGYSIMLIQMLDLKCKEKLSNLESQFS
jgi:hypothetical protein